MTSVYSSLFLSCFIYIKGIFTSKLVNFILFNVEKQKFEFYHFPALKKEMGLLTLTGIAAVILFLPIFSTNIVLWFQN